MSICEKSIKGYKDFKDPEKNSSFNNFSVNSYIFNLYYIDIVIGLKQKLTKQLSNYNAAKYHPHFDIINNKLNKDMQNENLLKLFFHS